MNEIRVYGIDVINYDLDISPNLLNDEEFIKIAEEQGLVWSLNTFQEQFNDDEINSNNIFIRFIEK